MDWIGEENHTIPGWNWAVRFEVKKITNKPMNM